MAIYTCGYRGFDRMTVSKSADSSHLSDTEVSISTEASPNSLMPGPYSFEPSEYDSEGSSGTLTRVQMMITLRDSFCHDRYS